ncbi:alpha/beta hydrolase [Aeromicrobium sp. CF3.5]|uniref:alpha/beta hydrolase n=1 Tax=Aeromicrobium sp. CF3.5 TaxID=3373078 RepID=UPI003EE6B867
MSRDLDLTSRGVRLGATWFPAGSDDLAGPNGRPCVVMAHGFGCTRDGGLAAFAERFADAGCQVVTFDYRGFGTSDGEPRQRVSYRRQRQDYAAVVAAVRQIDDVDPDRVVVWGTFYSGGHVVAVAAGDHRIAAVISQGAAVDGLAILRKQELADPRTPRSKGPRMLAAALRDLSTVITGREPVRVDSVGAPGDFALLTADDFADYLGLMGPTWRNAVCARSLLGLPFNRAVLRAGDVSCPALFVIAEQDSIAPPTAVREAARRVGPLAEVAAYDCPHFDIYGGQVFEESVSAQVGFLTRILGGASGSAP